jgi:ABC-type sugar transport system substrate-binding protein
MKKNLLFITVVVLISIIVSLSLFGCKAEPEVIVETVVKTVTETVEVEKEPEEEPVEEEKVSYLWGEEALYWGDEFLITLSRAAQYYAQDQGDTYVSLNPNLSVEASIRDLRYMTTGMNVDGILISPLSEEALVEPIEYCIDQGVPVVCYNTNVKTDKMPLSIMVSNVKFGESAAEALIKEIDEDGIEPKGTVFVLGAGDPDFPVVLERNNGIKSVLEKYPEIEIVEYFISGAAVEKTKEKVVEGITSFGRPLAIFGTNCTTDVGVIEALKTKEMYVKRGEPEHVYVGCLDTPSPIKEAMIEKYVDVSVDQPNLAYGFLSVYFLRIIKEQGVDALPPIGSTVINDPEKPEGPQSDGTWNAVPMMEEHEGVCPTDMTYWAPAPVIELDGHRWIQVGLYVSTSETVEDAPIWINVVEKWLK